MWRIRSARSSTASSSTAVILAAILATAAGSAAAQVIDTVIVENANIFDERDRSLAARWANALHVTTSPWVVRRTILLRAGEPYDSALVVESARALRRLGVFRFVAIDTLRVESRLAARVRTADGWSTRPTLSFAVTSGDATWAVGLREANLLGTAIGAGARYRSTPDRDGLELDFFNPHFLARHGMLELHYANYSDGRRLEWAAGKPFRETITPWALTTDGLDARQRILVFRGGALDSTVERVVTVAAVRGGVALTATPRDVFRVWGSLAWRREDFLPDTAGARAPYSTFLTAGAGMEAVRVRLRTIEGFNSYARSEDVDLSQVLRVGVWVAPSSGGYPSERAGAGPEVAGQLSTVWRGGFSLLRAAGRGIWTSAGLDSGRVEGAITLASQNLPRQTIILHGEGGAAEAPAPGGEFDLWLNGRGPRLFGAHAFTGTRRSWIVLEDRFLVQSDWLGLIGVGLAPFVEWGGAWYADETPRTGGNAGLALRLGANRSVRGSTFELAGGWRFGVGWEDRRWALTVRTGYRFAAPEP